MDTTKNETTTNIVFLTGFQRNGSAMIGLSFHDVDHVSNLGDVFMSNYGPLPSLRQYATRWREHILREAFGMNRVPYHVTSTVSNIGPFASPLACSKIFNALVEGKAQSDITLSLNNDDKALLCKASFQHCPGYFHVWDEMLNHPQCKVIYVRRENPVVLAVSSANASKQQQWQVKTHEDQSPKVDSVKLEPRHLMEFCAFYDSQSAFFDGYFSNYKDKVLVIDFEDLIESWNDQVRKICEFIEIEQQEIECIISQQIPVGNHVSLISNLGELIKYFRGTHWEECFRLDHGT